ncbi:questin oxidase family protein [Shewanella sp. D64]|uniref:questin oxidase family protein n=1 Tax=unclassified Shewanella TaxID=196818 RepID=UPI0022BA165C|nr:MULTISPECIES: questin oxidase family protein [unclassified Shewanella]MEC4723991.1 questin oxidase family protein [Shewanella sp. D64]MEC4736011.1 questin oxidase family protein [Shewanella sp. E94]WBJ93030.1 questin oxidase family protein [Shewanella sp. MTB7]
MNNTHDTYQTSTKLIALVNQEMHADAFYHPNLGGITRSGMANHFPMTIMSLAALGGTDDDIQRFKSRWPRNRTLIHQMGLRDSQTVNLDNWPQYLGKPELLIEFKRVFLTGIEHLGAVKFINHALDIMADALPMGLFHPLIRLSFARMQGDHGLIADALAYFAIRYQDLYGYIEQSSDVATNENVAETYVLSTWSSISGPSLRVGEQLCGSPYVQTLAFDQGFSITRANLSTRMSDICKAAVALYLYEPALTTLHAVTAAQALVDLTLSLTSLNAVKKTDNNTRTIDSDIQIYVKLWQRYWIWLMGLYLEKRAPKLEFSGFEAVVSQLPDWLSLASSAVKLNEVHDIKMVFSCKWLAENLDDHEIYRVAASQVMASY